MTNLEKAKILYKSGEYTCVLCKGDELYTSTLRGIAPMLGFIENGTELKGFCAADKIVGKAAAMLFVHAEVSGVYAEVMSRAAIGFFGEHGVKCSCDTVTDAIINRVGSGMCPMELAVSEISDTGEALSAIKTTIENLRQYRTITEQ